MKFRLLLGILLLVLRQAGGQYLAEENERQRILKNRVKTKTEYEHQVKDGKTSALGTKVSLTTYDTRGNIVEKISYRYNGDISSRLNYKYDSRGNRIEYTRFDGRKNQFTMQQYTRYDNNNNKIEEWGKNGPESTFKNIFAYNNTGQLTEIRYFYDDILSEVRRIKYSNSYRDVYIYKGNNILDYTLRKKVDPKDNVTEETKLSPSNEALQKTVYIYEKDLLVKEEQYYGGALKIRIVNIYDPYKHLIEVRHETSDGKSYTNNYYTYDSSGKLLSEKWYNEEKNDYSTKKYLYDKKGNLMEAHCHFVQFGTEYIYKYEYTTY